MNQSLLTYFNGDPEIAAMLQEPGFAEAARPFVRRTLQHTYALYKPSGFYVAPPASMPSQAPVHTRTAALHVPEPRFESSPIASLSPSTASAKGNGSLSKITALPTTERSAIVEEIIALLQKETDYPREMLEVDKSLESDLGVDSVTQAEVLGTMRKRYGLPVEEGFRLRNYPTIDSWVDYIAKRVSEFQCASAATA